MRKITKIVLSGGPSGGKSESLEPLKNELEKLGFRIYAVKEAASEVVNSGVERGAPVFDLQKKIAEKQLRDEAETEKLVPEDSEAVIIFDRGLMDARVYLGDEDFSRFKSELELSDVELRDRYDAVFHMESTSTDENTNYSPDEMRIEERESAKDINDRSLRAWCGNPHYRFIPVTPDYPQKFELLLREVKAFLGIPKPLEIERKYLIKFPDRKVLETLPFAEVEIEQTYLIDDEGCFRLRKRGSNGNYIYILTRKRKISELVREETETRLTEEEYNRLMSSAKIVGTIGKKRLCVMHGGVYYEIDIFPFWKKQAYLEIELPSEDAKPLLPDFVEIIREVTNDDRYKNIALCQSIPKEDL